MDEKLIEELGDIVGPESISAALTDRVTHSSDATRERHLPEVVVSARSAGEVGRVLSNERE